MVASTFQLDLATYGPTAAATPAPALAEAQAYCRRLATSHYENFTVASWLLPRELRQHFCNVYAYCRWADDLADETGNPQHSLELLDWWDQQLTACYAGRTQHPVFVALRETIEKYAIPCEPFRALLSAFRQDQAQTRYESFDELLNYCQRSANPVGHLVLYLGRCHHGLTMPLSDSICTGLQLVNHWQDVARDLQNGRLYLPMQDCRRFEVSEAALREPAASLEVCRLLEFEVQRAKEYLTAGWPLVTLVSRELKLPVELFLRGGLAIADAIEQQGYDVLVQRPTISKRKKAHLLWQSLCSRWLGRREPAA